MVYMLHEAQKMHIIANGIINLYKHFNQSPKFIAKHFEQHE